MDIKHKENNRKLSSFFFKEMWLLLLFIVPVMAFSQETVVAGQVIDKYDKLPVSSVSIYFKNTDTGTISNEEGYFMIRSFETERTLVFSSVGYKTKEIKVKAGHTSYINVELVEENTWLQDVFVIPGINPALDWLKKIRLVRNENDITNYPHYQVENVQQDLILLNREQRTMNRRIFNQLEKGNLSDIDSVLVVPLYMAETTYKITNKRKTEISKKLFSTPQVADQLVLQLLKGIDADLNFYNNSVNIFGKSILSPLASIGNSYYHYFLVDSIETPGGKQYEINFRSKNQKNLAFNGKFRFDSATVALTYIEAELPRWANINYVQYLKVKQQFEVIADNRWILSSSELTMNLTYDIITADNVNLKPGLFIKQSSRANIPDSLEYVIDNFAGSEYTTEVLERRLHDLDNTPLMRTAKWIADAAITGYARAGYIDVEPLKNVMRLTDEEGFRLNVPVRTNEHLWKNISVGGYAGYGFKNKEIKYSVFGQYRLPTEKRRILEFRYTDDYRRIDYNYNNNIVRESPWGTDDENIVSTIFFFYVW